jgi:hypothetical protein
MPQFTFDPSAVGFSQAAALYLANASDLAYSDDPAAAAKQFLGLEARTFRHTDSDTQGFVGRAPDFAVLAFRGSEKINEHPKDWLVDFQLLQTRDPSYAGQVHRGFAGALTAAWNDVDAVLRAVLQAAGAVDADTPGLPVFVTGHSLGGALATLATCRLASISPPDRPVRLAATYTFGAPRVGDPDFCAAFTRPPVYRIVHNLDLVPLVPFQGPELQRLRNVLPVWAPGWIRNLAARADHAPTYGNVGALVYLDAAGKPREGAERPDWTEEYLRQSVRSLGRSLNAPVTDHGIDGYIRALSQKPS